MCFVPLSVESLLVCCACSCCFCCCLTDLVSVCLVVTFAYAAAKVIAFAQPSTSTSTAPPLQLCLPETRPTAPQLLKCPKMSNCLSTQRRFVRLPSPSLSPLSSLSPSVDLPALSAIWDSVEVFGLGGVGYVGFHLENTSKMPIASPLPFPLAAARTLRHFCNRNPNHTQIAITSICFDCPPSDDWRRFVFNCFH